MALTPEQVRPMARKLLNEVDSLMRDPSTPALTTDPCGGAWLGNNHYAQQLWEASCVLYIAAKQYEEGERGEVAQFLLGDNVFKGQISRVRNLLKEQGE